MGIDIYRIYNVYKYITLLDAQNISHLKYSEYLIMILPLLILWLHTVN